jgi:hypothetical protein
MSGAQINTNSFINWKLEMTDLIYEDRPRYDFWLKIILWSCVAIVLIPALFMFDSNMEEAIGLILTAVFVVIIFWAVMPRKYRIYDDRIKILLGTPFSISISFDTIEYAGVPRRKFTVGMNLVTSFRNIVEISRKKGMNVNISPSDRDNFLENLNRALDKWRGEHSKV